jgi:hypothetical protein
VLVATAAGAVPSRDEVRLLSAERVAYGRESCSEFLAYMARLEALAGQLRGKRVALYGAGFYGVLVQAQLDQEQVQVTDLFDANPRKEGTSRLGLTVRSPDALSSGQWSDVDLVMCINPQIAASVGKKLAPHVRAVHII